MNYSKKLMIITALLFASQYIVAQTSGYQKLDEDDLDQVDGGYNPRLPYYQYFDL